MIDSALDAVIEQATSPASNDVREQVVYLVGCGETRLVPRLRSALSRFLDDGNFYGRDLIAEILAGIAGMRALPDLLRASARDLGDDQDTLSALIVELLTTDPAAARPTVLAFVTDPAFRLTGLWALGFVLSPDNLASPAAAPLPDAALPGSPALPASAALPGSPALPGSAALRDDAALLAAAAADPDAAIRSVALGSLPNPAGNDTAYQLLLAALNDPAERVRVSAISRIGFAGRTEAAPAITALADDPSAQVRRFAADALGILARAAARNRLGSGNALGRVAGTDVLPVLLRLIRDSDSGVRENAITALGSVGGPEAIATLLELADHLDAAPMERRLTVRALAKAGAHEPHVMDRLAALTRDTSSAVRAAAVTGLPRDDANPARWNPLVEELAADPDPEVRMRVAHHARRLTDGIAEQILQRHITDPDPRVRHVATRQLHRQAD